MYGQKGPQTFVKKVTFFKVIVYIVNKKNINSIKQLLQLIDFLYIDLLIFHFVLRLLLSHCKATKILSFSPPTIIFSKPSLAGAVIFVEKVCW